MAELAPIVLFCYKRLSHLQQTIQALRDNVLAAESNLYIFSDGAKNTEDAEEVNAVRLYLKTISGFKKIQIIEQKNNLGLSASIKNGVSEIVNKYGKVIVLEDDIVTAKYFLKFINDGLNFYQNDDRIQTVIGYIYPVKGKLPDNFFLEGSESWGWGTWKRSWDLFEPDAKKLLQQLKESGRVKHFDFNGAYYYSAMLEYHSQRIIPAWDILFHTMGFLKKKLTLYPGKPLVQNIGHDNTGVHCKESTIYYHAELWNEPVDVVKIEVEENATAYKLFEDFYRRNHNPTILQRIIRRIKKQIK